MIPLKIKTKLKKTKAEILYLEEKLEAERKRSGIMRFLESKPLKDLKIKTPKKEKGKTHYTAILHASDWHIEERVDPKRLHGLNQYNPQIAEVRARNFFINSMKLIKRFTPDEGIDNIVLALNGDYISGYIHEELQEENYL
jgi:hypothetical protein